MLFSFFFVFVVVVGWGRDVTSHSFGEGYATRCDEEGFGGIYGGNDPLSSEEKTPSKIIHESHPGLYSLCLSLSHEIQLCLLFAPSILFVIFEFCVIF